MRFSDDPDDPGSLVQWYFTEPGAGVLPYETTFASRNWEYSEPWTWPVAGEILGSPRLYASGTRPSAAPSAASAFPCGTAAEWAGEVPSAGAGAVGCCEQCIPPGATLWWDAADLQATHQQNDPVMEWPPHGGTAFTGKAAAFASAPLFNDHLWLPVKEGPLFNTNVGVESVLSFFVGSTLTTITAAGDFTYLMASSSYRDPAAGSGKNMVMGTAGDIGQLGYRFATLRFIPPGGGGQSPAFQLTPGLHTYYFAIRRKGTNVQFWSSKVFKGRATVTGTGSFRQVRRSNDTAPEPTWTILHELLFYQRALTGPEISSAIDCLTQKWGTN